MTKQIKIRFLGVIFIRLLFSFFKKYIYFDEIIWWLHVLLKKIINQQIIFRHVLHTILLLLWLIGAKGKRTVHSNPHGFWMMKPLMIQVLNLCFLFITKENQFKITLKLFKSAKGILISSIGNNGPLFRNKRFMLDEMT